MDRNPPPIIKSGARHSVQIAQGSTHAKSVRNVVTSDADAPLEERLVNADSTTLREEATLQQGLLQTQQVAAASEQGIAPEDGAQAASTLFIDEEAAAARDGGLAIEADAASAASGEGPIVSRTERGASDAQVAKTQPEAEHRVLLDQAPVPADTQGVVVEATPQQENRQRIEQLQAQANRIRLRNEQRAASELNAAQATEPVRHEHGLSAADVARPKEAVPAEEALLAAAAADMPAVAPELPPEAANNLAAQNPSADAKESALMARLRALKSNMTVTENRLTKLKAPDADQA